MFRKFFGGKKNRQKRLSPSAATPEGLMQSHPMFQYAMREYAQTVPAQTQNEDGRIRPIFSMSEGAATADPEVTSSLPRPEVGHDGGDVMPSGRGSGKNKSEYQQRQESQSSFGGDVKNQSGGGTNLPPILRATSYKSATTTDVGDADQRGGLASSAMSRQSSGATNPHFYTHPILSPRAEYVMSDEESQHNQQRIPRSSSPPSIQQQPSAEAGSSRRRSNMPGHQQRHPRSGPSSSPFDPTANADTTYEETYGDAYIGGPMRYVYPSGYQSMRPRSGPWKLSIVVCLIFTWLSVFVIGYCSDQAGQSSSSSSNVRAYEFDDDKLAIETKWCGSRLLYWMWVISMLITGLATAYCSVIGYIKLRDFAVANSRMQPTGYMGKSDYYVQLSDHPVLGEYHRYPYGGGGGNSTLGSTGGQPIHPANYSQTIYQADGSPQFWGNHIYRPTQAAVMITSR